MYLIKNPKTGLYESVDSAGNKIECKKLCKIEYAKEVYKKYLKDSVPSIFESSVYLTNDDLQLNYGKDDTDNLTYYAAYDKQTCFKDSTYKCTTAGGENTYSKKYGSKCSNPTIDKDKGTAICEKDISYYHYKYVVNYDKSNCKLKSSNKIQSCTKANAIQMFKDTLKRTYNINATTITQNHNRFEYQTGSTYQNSYIYYADYDPTNCLSGFTGSRIWRHVTFSYTLPEGPWQTIQHQTLQNDCVSDGYDAPWKAYFWCKADYSLPNQAYFDD